MSALSAITNKVSQISGLERKYTAMIKNPLGALAPQRFGFLSNSWLTRMKGRSDPVLAFDWDIQLPTFGKDPIITLGSEYVEAVGLVFPEFDTREVFRAGVMERFPAGKIIYDDLTLTFYADINNKSFSYIKMWMNYVGFYVKGDGVAFGRPKSDSALLGYKKDITVYLKDPYQQNLLKIDYVGCWPTNMSQVELVGDTSDRVTWQVTFAVDYIRLSGYNLDTITGAAMDLVSGTIKNVMKQASDVMNTGAKALGSNVVSAVQPYAKDALNSISNAFGINTDNT